MVDDAAPTPTTEKHPILVDAKANPISYFGFLGENGGTFVTTRQDGDYKQSDYYLSVNPAVKTKLPTRKYDDVNETLQVNIIDPDIWKKRIDEVHSETNTTNYNWSVTKVVGAFDIAKKDPHELHFDLGKTYYNLGQSDFLKSGTSKTENANADAQKFVDDMATQIINQLKDPQNAGSTIAIVGASSKDQHPSFVQGKNADGTLQTNPDGSPHMVSLNDQLAWDRAYSAEKIIHEAIERKLKESGEDPKPYLDRIVPDIKSVGDREAKAGTREYRSVSFQLVSNSTIESEDREKTIVHVDPEAIARIHIYDAKHPEEFKGLNVDFGLGTPEIQALAQKSNTALTKGIPTHGYVMLEGDIKEPIDINLLGGADCSIANYKFAVRDPKQVIAYVHNDNNTISITADGKPIAILHNQMVDGPAFKQDPEISMAKVGADGKTFVFTPVSVDAAAEQKHAQEAKAAAQKNEDAQILNSVGILTLKLNIDPIDEKVTTKEMANYAAQRKLRASIGAADKDGDGALSGQEILDQEKLTPGFKAAVEVYTSSTDDKGNTVMYAKQRETAENADKAFDILLEENGFTDKDYTSLTSFRNEAKKVIAPKLNNKGPAR